MGSGQIVSGSTGSPLVLHSVSYGSGILGAESGILVALIFAALALLAMAALVPIIVVVANRAEPDPRGMRPHAVYFFGMAFVTLLLAYSGATMIVTSLLSFVGPHSSPIADSVARFVVIGAILVAVAGSVMVVHVRRGLAIADGDGRPDGPNARVLKSYASAVTFLFVLSAVFSLGIAIYLLFELAGPGIFGGSTSTATLRTLLDVIYLMLASGGIVLAHSRLAPSLFGRTGAAPEVAQPA